MRLDAAPAIGELQNRLIMMQGLKKKKDVCVFTNRFPNKIKMRGNNRILLCLVATFSVDAAAQIHLPLCAS